MAIVIIVMIVAKVVVVMVVIVVMTAVMYYLGSRSVIIHLLQFLNEVIMTFGQIPIAPSILSAPFVTLFFVFVQARVGPLFVG